MRFPDIVSGRLIRAKKVACTQADLINPGEQVNRYLRWAKDNGVQQVQVFCDKAHVAAAVEGFGLEPVHLSSEQMMDYLR